MSPPPSTPVGRLWRLALRRPRTVLIPALAAAVWLAAEARHLRLEAAIDLLSPSDPLAVADRTRQEQFGDDFRIVLALYRSDREGGILAPDSFAALADLHRTLAAHPGIRTVCSLINAPALVGSPGLPAGSPLLDLRDLPEARPLVRRLHASEIQKVMLLSPRWSLTPLYVELEEAVEEAVLAREVSALAATVEARHPGAGRVLVVGPAVVETGLAEHIFQDLSRLIPFAVALIFVGLLVVFRRAVLLVVALVHALVLIAVVLGGMAACGLTVNLVSVLAPVILIPVGVADLLHLFVRLRAGIDPGAQAGPTVPLASAFAHLERPMLGTSLTTAIGFLGFLISPVAAIRQFGLTMSAGTVVALVVTFTVDAALLALLWQPRPAARRRRRASLAERWLLAQRSPARLALRSRVALVLSLGCAVAGLAALTRVRIEDTWITNFDPRSEVVRDTLCFEGEYFGTNVLAVVFTADPAVPGAQRRALDAVNRLGHSVMVVPGIRGVLSATLLARALDPEQGRPWLARPTPSRERMLADYAAWEERGMPLPRMRMLADPGLERFQVQIFVLNQPYPGLVKWLTTIRDRAVELAGPGVRASTSGNLAVNIRMVRLAVLGQAFSLLTLLVVITLLAVGYTRSPAAGGVLVLPMVLAILLTYLCLVLLGIDYGIAVAMFPTLVVGLAVDFAIHLRAAVVRNRGASRTRWARDLAVVVRGILLNGAVWAAGFAILIVSTLPPNRYLGLLCCIVVLLSTLLTLLLFPTLALIVSAAPSRELP